MRKVDFIVCGIQKGGTKALDFYLRSHPELCLPVAKEIHFFDNEQLFREPKINYRAYHAHFVPKPEHKLIGEGTPIYIYWNSAPRRMWQYNPNLKLIVVIRNPIERAYSHWNMCRQQNAESLSFWDAIQAEPERCRTALPGQHRLFSYIDRGFYVAQLRRLWSFFPREQVLTIKSDDLKENPRQTMQQVFDHLGVSMLPDIETKNVHAIPYTSSITEKERDHLRYVYEFEIRSLERLLGWDCSSWLSDQ